jgi:hypothetical protein
VVTFVEKQSGYIWIEAECYICGEAEGLHLWRGRVITFVEKQSVTFVEKQSGNICGKAEWLHLCRTRIVAFLERQSHYLHFFRRSRMVTFM